MAYIYVYDKRATDCSSIGLRGALMDYDAVFEQEAGEFGELTFKHPVDPWGKWLSLQEGMLLKTDVPCRLPYELTAKERKNRDPLTGKIYTSSASSYVVYKVATTATKVERMVYYADCPDNDPDDSNGDEGKKPKTKCCLKANKEVVILKDTDPGNTHNGRYKIRVTNGKKKIVGYMEKSGLTATEKIISYSETGGTAVYPDWMEEVNPSYAIMPQLFRIYGVETNSSPTDPGTLTVRARRLCYDLLGNVCTYLADGWHSGRVTAKAILKKTVYRHPFTIDSDIGDKRVGFDARDRNPIEALLDPDEGMATRWRGQVYCDDYDLYVMHRAGLDRGVKIEYMRNLTGITCKVDTSNVASAVRPVGERANGEPLYLDGKKASGKNKYNLSASKPDTLPSGFKFAVDNFADGKGHKKSRIRNSVIARSGSGASAIQSYAAPKCMILHVRDARVTKTKKDTDPSETKVVTTVLARRMLAQAAAEAFTEDRCDEPDISLDVDFTLLGDTDEYKQFRHLEPMFLYDSVLIRHKRLGIQARMQLTGVKWDIRGERMLGAQFSHIYSRRGEITRVKLRSTNTLSAKWKLGSGSLSPYAMQQASLMAYQTTVSRLRAAGSTVDDDEEQKRGVIVGASPSSGEGDENIVALGGMVSKIHVLSGVFAVSPGDSRTVDCTFYFNDGSNPIATNYDWYPGDGWTPLYIAGYSISNALTFPSRMYVASNNNIVARLRYTGTSSDAFSLTVKVFVLCACNMNEEYDEGFTYDDTEVYSSENTYDVGDKVIYDGNDPPADDAPEYECVVAITTPEAWNAAHWELVSEPSEKIRMLGDLEEDPADDDEVDEDFVEGAEVYSSEYTYAVGDRVAYNGDEDPAYDMPEYECITAITTPEEWNASHWTLVSE